jgi:hypothetical protein
MKTSLSLLALLATITVGTGLSTDYTHERTLRTETKVVLEMETTKMERDGEPFEGRGGPSSSEETRHAVQVDHILENKDGKPTHVKRSFEEVEGEIEMTRGDNTFTIALEGPLAGVTLELKAGKGDEIEVTAAEGKVDDTDLLEGHQLALALDALLPDEEVKEGASWDLSEEAIERAMGLDLARKLYRVSEEGADTGGGGGGGGGRGGRGFGGRMGGEGFSGLDHVEWKGEAKLAALGETHDGEKCARIELELEGQGDLPVPDFGRGRDRERVFGSEAAPAILDGNTIEAKLTGTLWFAVESRRPRALELTGEIKMSTEFTFERDGESTTMSTEREGKCDLGIEITEE